MVTTALLSLLGGLIGANGIPDFVSGITRRQYVCRPGLSLGWHFVLRDGRISVGAGPRAGVSTSVAADYAVLRFLQRFEVAGLGDRREELTRLHDAFGARGDFHVEGEERLAALPAYVLERLIPLHDRIAAVTA